MSVHASQLLSCLSLMGKETEVWGEGVGGGRGREGRRELGKEQGREREHTFTSTGHVLSDLHPPTRPYLLGSPSHALESLI